MIDPVGSATLALALTIGAAANGCVRVAAGMQALFELTGRSSAQQTRLPVTMRPFSPLADPGCIAILIFSSDQ
ncbi:MAG: hypothetical protein AAGG06_16545 [Pseudomonadota bacterium]